MGAALLSRRYPRLCSPTPLVSSMRVTSSFIIEKRICAIAPVSGMVCIPYALQRFTAIAFFTIFWHAGMLFSVEFSECPVFGNAS